MRGVQPYQYRKLKDGDIRILLLLPGQGVDPIAAELHNMILDDTSVEEHHPNAFEALSYAWGQDSTDYSLSIGAHQLPITESLNSALRRLRVPDQVRRLWVDAVCINQDDPAEKEQQVGHMAKIYSSARRVVVYLGEASADSDAAIDLVDRYWRTMICRGTDDNELGRKLDPFETALLLGLQHSDVDMSWKNHELPANDSPDWYPIVRLSQRPWFSRMWIIQEFVTARDVVMYCGNREFRWSHLFAMFTSYDGPNPHPATEALPALMGTEDWIGMDNFMIMANQRAYRLLKTRPEGRRLLATLRLCSVDAKLSRSSWADLLYFYRRAGCKLERDRLFALLSVASDVDVAKHPELQPDYRTGDKEWLAKTANVLIQLPGGEEMFMYAGIGEHQADWKGSSWMQPWRHAEMSAVWKAPSNIMPQCRAAGNSGFIVSGVRGWSDAIALKACKADDVVGCAKSKSSQDWESHGDIGKAANVISRLQLGYVLDALIMMLPKVMTVNQEGVFDGGTNNEMVAAMFRALLANPTPAVSFMTTEKDLTILVSKLCGQALIALKNSNQKNVEDVLRRLIHDEHGFASALSPSGSKANTDEFEQSNALLNLMNEVILPVVSGMSPGVIQGGSFASLPLGTKPGDEVWVVSGCRLPAIFRKSDAHPGTRRLIGFCYANGIMSGEIMQRKDFVWEDVIIY